MEFGASLRSKAVSRFQPLVGIDIGSSAIRVIVAEEDSDNGGFRVSGASIGESRGMRRGQVLDIGELADALRNALLKLHQEPGFNIDRAVVNIGGSHLVAVKSKGVVAVSRADSEISEEDVARVLAAAQAVPVGLNREVLHVIPQEFTVDGEAGLKNVVGMSGVRLEVSALLIQASSPVLRNVERALSEGGIAPESFVASGLAAGESALSERQRELGVLLLDIGLGTTDFAVFEDGECIHAAVFPLGSGHITNDLAIGMRTSLEVAERAKIEEGTCGAGGIGKKETVDLAALGSNEGGIFSRAEAADIIVARVEEILDCARKELRKIGRDRLLPAGVVLVGGGAKLGGLADYAREYLGLPARIGTPDFPEQLPAELRDPAFATVLGLLAWKMGDDSLPSRTPFGYPNVGEGLRRLKNIFRNFLP